MNTNHDALREALDEIGGLSRALRVGGPDPSDLQELSDALQQAVDIANNALSQPMPEAAAQGCEETSIYCCEFCFSSSGETFLNRMIVCSECGNKRCPKATFHENACTNSNEVGQPGSSWEHVKPPLSASPAAPEGERPHECWPEHIMRQWDYWRKQIANGDTSSAPRDWFESLAPESANPEHPSAQPQAQGEPEVVAEVHSDSLRWRVSDDHPIHECGQADLITLQSHREAIANRDAALDAEFLAGWEAGLKKAAENWETWYGFDKNGAAEMCRTISSDADAITQAKAARGGKEG